MTKIFRKGDLVLFQGIKTTILSVLILKGDNTNLAYELDIDIPPHGDHPVATGDQLQLIHSTRPKRGRG